MTTEANAHENKDTNTDLKRRAGLSWVGLCSVRVVFAVFLAALTVLCGCNLFGGVSPSASMAQKVATAIEKTDKVEQDFKDVSGSIVQLKTDMTTMETNISNKIEQTTVTHNESLKSLAWTAALIWFAYEALKFLRAFLIAKFTPGSTLANLVKGKK